MSRLLVIVLSLLSAFLWSKPTWAQVAAASTRPLTLAGYGEIDASAPELGRGVRLGGTLGVLLEHSRYLGLDARGVALVALQPIHTFILEAGPRVAPVYGKYQPYAEGLVGLGHTEYGTATTPGGKGTGFTWTVAGGVDRSLSHGFEWRVAEVSFTYIRVGSGVSPVMFGSGLVYRF
jgi:hypothetical protein